MNNFWLLIKTNFQMTFLNRIFKKLSKKTPPIIITLLIVLTLIILLVLGLYLFIFASLFNQGGRPELILALILLLVFILCLMNTIFRLNSYLFRTKDFDMLMSMPIKPQVIVLSKMVSLLFINYLFVFFIYLPTQVIYAIYVPTDIIFWILSIVAYFFIPILPVVIASFIAYLFGFIPIPSKAKNILSIVLSLVIFIGIMSINIFMNTDGEDIVGFVNKIDNLINKPYFLSTYLFLGIRGNILYYLIYLVISAISFVLFLFIVSKTFVKANSANKINIRSKNFKLEKNYSSKRKSLIKKEFKTYVGVPGYVVNTIVGPVMTLLFIVFLLIEFNKSGGMTTEEFTITKEIIPVLLIAIMTFFIGITTTTASSISLEGKNFWIIKSFPVKTKDVLVAKIVINLVITIPFVIIDYIVTLIFLDLPFESSIFILLIPSIYTIIVSILGLLYNLLFPKFDFDNPIKVIKQGISVLLTMVTGFTFAILLGVVGLVLSFFVSLLVVYIIVTILLFIALFIVIKILFSKGIKKYDSLNC